MSIVTDLKNNIETRLESVLGGDYSKIAYATDVSLNKFNRATKRFGIVPGAAVDTSGTVGASTLDHRFTILLTDTFNAGAAAQVGDALKLERINELQDKALLIFKDLQTNKSSLSPKLLIVNDINISEAEFLEDEKVIVLRFDINFKYRI